MRNFMAEQPPAEIETVAHRRPARRTSWDHGHPGGGHAAGKSSRRGAVFLSVARLLPAAIGVEIKGEINRARSVTELPKLIGAEVVPQCTGEVMKSGLAQHDVIEQSLDDDHLRTVLNSVPGV